MGACCNVPTTNRSRSASDPTDKNPSAPKFSPVNVEEDGDGNKSDEQQINNNQQNGTQIESQVGQHIGLTKQVKRRMSGSFEAKLITVNIENMNNKEIKQLPIMNSLTVSQMKSLIAKHCGIVEPRQKLKYNDMILDSNQLLSIYNISDNDTIYLYVLQDSDILELIVDYKSGTIKKEIWMTATCKLIDFRKEVQGKIPMVSLNEQQFFYNDTELDDDEKLLKDYGIINQSIIRFEWNYSPSSDNN